MDQFVRRQPRVAELVRLLGASTTLIPPKVLEPVGRHFGVPDRVLDVLVPEVVLQGPRVVAIVGEFEPTGMAKHVRVDGEWHLGGLPEALDKPVETIVAYEALASRHPGLGGRWGFHSSPGERAGGPRTARSAAIAGRRPPMPADRGDRRPGSWSRRDARSGHACGRSLSAGRSPLGEIAPLDCQVYDAWGAFLGYRFHADKPCLRISYCICYTSFLHSRRVASVTA